MLQTACIGLALVGAACGSTSIDTPRPTPTPTPVATRTASPSATLYPTTAAILKAYDQAVAVYVAAEATANPDYPGLSQWYTNPEYTTAYTRIDEMELSGFVVKGSITPHAAVTAVNGTTATVSDCAWDTTNFVDKATGSTPSPQPFGTTLGEGWDSITATMVLSQSGVWQLSSQQVEVNATCTPASP